MKTYGDSTKTPGEHIDDRCYILAQFPETVNLDWARDLRSVLGGGELKYQKYLALRHRVQADKRLWKRVLDGTAEATVVVIENAFYINAIAYRLKKAGAELGHDVTFEQISGSYDRRSNNTQAIRVSESRSESNDWLQAADFCAGFASEIMMNASDDRERDLRRHFRRVIFNGATR